jgi:hypothetical protein
MAEAGRCGRRRFLREAHGPERFAVSLPAVQDSLPGPTAEYDAESYPFPI